MFTYTKGKDAKGTEISLGERLLDLRKMKHLTQEQAGEQAGVTKATISNYENNITSPTFEVLDELLKVYGTSYLEFFDVDAEAFQKDVEVFKKYGLNKHFAMELLLYRKLGGVSATAKCLGLLFQYPVYASSMFEALSHIFDALTSQEGNASKLYPSTPEEQRAFQGIMFQIAKEVETEGKKTKPKK